MSLLAGILGACAEEGGPSFAPDAATETAVRALTPAPTATIPAIDRQPGERVDPELTLAELAAGRGSAGTIATRDGDTVTLFDTATGGLRQIEVPESTGLVGAGASNDGTTIVALRREGSRLVLERVGANGESIGSLDLSAASIGTPTAVGDGTPIAEQTLEPVTRDRLEISPDGRHLVVVSREGHLSIVSVDPALTIVRVIQDFGDVSTLGWTADSTLALVGTYDRSRTTGNLTGVPLDGRLRSILRLPAGDGRRIISVASPAGSLDVFYVARSAVDDWTAQNNLYRIPLVGGTPSVVLATGLVGPAGAVDRFAVADDGRTVAATLLIPRGEDLAFHSLWVTDIGSARPLEVETGAIGLVSRLAWTNEGLFVVGVQRERTDSASRLVTVSLLLETDGSLRELGRSESAATPVASPISTPEPSSPVASPSS